MSRMPGVVKSEVEQKQKEEAECLRKVLEKIAEFLRANKYHLFAEKAIRKMLKREGLSPDVSVQYINTSINIVSLALMKLLFQEKKIQKFLYGHQEVYGYVEGEQN